MNKKNQLENILTLTKSLAKLYCDGFIEGTNKSVTNLIGAGLNKILEVQKETFKFMSETGMYVTENVETKKISKELKKLVA